MSKNTKKKVYIALILILAVAFVLQIATEGFKGAGLYILVGFVGALACILLAKKILAPFVQRDTDYYEHVKVPFPGPDFLPNSGDEDAEDVSPEKGGAE